MRARGVMAVLLLVALAAVLGVGVDAGWAWLAVVDDLGRPASAWALAHGLRAPLLGVELAFATTGTAVLTVLLAVGLLVRRHGRDAALVLLVMLTQLAAFTTAKVVVARPRPPWQVDDGLLTSYSYPSGHATSTTALAGVVVVLLLGLVGPGATRRVLVGAAVATAVLVMLDRVLLGRHYPTDVLGGAALGVAIVLLWSCAGFTGRPRLHR